MAAGPGGAGTGAQGRGPSQYDAFLSYGHTADRSLAPALQSELQRYAKPWYRARAMRVFRDDANLAAEPGLWDAIERALAASSWFVLLASPAAAGSPWVDREVDWWLTHRSADRLLVVLTDGELDDALPPALRRAGLPEPRWVDLRGAARDGRIDRLDARLQAAVVDVAATVRGIPKDDLAGEHLRQRRRTLRWAGGAIAALTLLLVVALLASIAFAVTNGRLSAALNTANARTLGQQAQDRLPTDPGTAAQLALAAYRADPTQTDARDALGAAFVARRSTTATRSVPGAAPVTALAVDAAADVAVALSPSAPVVAEGLAGQAPAFAAVPDARAETGVIVTGGGRWVVAAEPRGAARVWDRATGSTRVLPGVPVAATPTPDGAHLIIGTATVAGTEVRVDDLATGSSTALTTLPDVDVANIWQTSDPGRILVRGSAAANGLGPLTLRDARTGTVLAALPPGARVGAGGSLVVQCAPVGRGSAVFVSDAASGVPRRRIGGDGASSPCLGHPALTADGRHIAWIRPTASSSRPADIVEIADLTDGHRTSAWVPAASGLNPAQPQSPRRIDPTPVGAISFALLSSLSVHGDRALVVDQGQIDTLALSPAPTWRNPPAEGIALPFAVGDGSTAVLSYDDGDADAVRTTDGTRLGTLSPAGLGLLPGESVTGRGANADRQTYVVITNSAQGERVRDFALPSFRPLGVFDLVAAGAAGFGTGDQDRSVVQAVAGDTVAVLAGGTLSWWSASGHRPVAAPVRLADDAAGAAALTAANAAGLVIDDAGDLVALREPGGTRPDGTTNAGGVALWRPGSGVPTRVTADLVPDGRALFLSGGRLITLERPGALVQRDAGTGAVLVPPIPAPSPGYSTGILGIGAGGLLVTDGGTVSVPTVGFWDLGANRPVGSLRLPTSEPGRLVNGRLDIDEGFDDFVSVPVDPGEWHRALCRAQDRPFTDAERAALPPGAGTDPPCS